MTILQDIAGIFSNRATTNYKRINEVMNLQPGDKVVINDDKWDNLNKTAIIVENQGHKVIVESEDGVTMTLSVNQVIPQRLLSE